MFNMSVTNVNNQSDALINLNTSASQVIVHQNNQNLSVSDESVSNLPLDTSLDHGQLNNHSKLKINHD